MHNSNRGWRAVAAVFLIAIALAVGWPAAFVSVHGWDPNGWPNIAGMATPREWLAALQHFEVGPIIGAYWKMAHGTSPAFAGGGVTEVTVLAAICAALVGTIHRRWVAAITIAAVAIPTIGMILKNTGEAMTVLQPNTIVWRLPSGAVQYQRINYGDQLVLISKSSTEALARRWSPGQGYATAIIGYTEIDQHLNR